MKQRNKSSWYNKKKKNKGKARYSNKFFTRKDLDEIREYLKNYQDKSSVSGSKSNDHEKSIVIEPSTLKGNIIKGNVRQGLKDRSFLLMLLTSPKQRRDMHQLCAVMGLHHETVQFSTSLRDNAYIKMEEGGTMVKENERYLLTSCHIEVVEQFMKDFRAPKYHVDDVPLHICNQWYYSPQNIEGLLTNSINSVKELQNYPDECMRDLEFYEKSLSSPLISSLNNDNALPEYIYVNTYEKMQNCKKEIHEELLSSDLDEKDSINKVIGFDLEMCNTGKYQCITCLIQLSVYFTSQKEQKQYIIDPFATPTVWSLIPSLLKPIFENPSIVKIGHSIHFDCKSLHRDFGIIIQNAFDTQEAFKQVLSFVNCIEENETRGLGLVSLCEYYKLLPKDTNDTYSTQQSSLLAPSHNDEESPPNTSYYFTLKQKYQSSDWTVRPLEVEKLRYASYDVYFLLELRNLLIRDLLSYDKLLLMRAIGKSQKNCLSLWKDPFFLESSKMQSLEEHEKNFLFSAYENKSQFNTVWTRFSRYSVNTTQYPSTSQQSLYMKLLKWRSDTSYEMCITCEFICATEFLAYSAICMPQTKQELQMISFFLPPVFSLTNNNGEEKSHLLKFLGIIESHVMYELEQLSSKEEESSVNNNRNNSTKNIFSFISIIPRISFPTFGIKTQITCTIIGTLCTCYYLSGIKHSKISYLR